MAFTYGSVERQVHMLLGNVVGADVSTVETNYAAALVSQTWSWFPKAAKS